MGYSWDNFLKPSSTTDTNIQIMDNNGVVTYTINPYAILNVLVNNNLLKISLKSGKVIIIQFSSINESKLALPRIKALIDSLTSKTPNFITNNVKNYVQSVVGVFFYQDNIPDNTGTNLIIPGTFWYDTEYGFLYVYVFDDNSDSYQWIGAAGEASPDSSKTPIVLIDASTIGWTYSNGFNAGVTIAGNRTLSISGATAGDSGLLKITQGGLGSFRINFGPENIFSSGTYSYSTQSGISDIYRFYYDGSNYFWSINSNYPGTI